MLNFNINFLYEVYDFFFMRNNGKIIAKLINYYKIKKIIVCDVGCYKGKFSHQLFKYLKNKKNLFFYLFDPNQDWIDYYKKLKFKYTFKNVAISNNIMKKNFYVNNFFKASGSSLKKTSFNDKLYMLFRAPKKIKTIKLTTNSLNNLKIKNITVLKIDTEGGGTEYDCLEGASKFLRNIKIISIECQNTNKKIENDIIKVVKYLDKNFNLILKQRIWSVSFLTNLKGYDLIFLNKKISY
jgi:FkbM family methyltransferase